jgi:SHS2 domain-containing protein
MMAGFEILEHTADVGVRAFGDSLPELFEQATRGLANVAGIWTTGEGEQVEVAVEGDDLGGLLVDWLSEILWLHDSRDMLLTSVDVAWVDRGVKGNVRLLARGSRSATGTQVKAVTYHQLRVERIATGWEADVYLDV